MKKKKNHKIKKSKVSLKGYVIKNKMNKTVIVSILRLVKHKIYGKFVKKTVKLYVHDEYNECKLNDFILIKQCRPLSKNKSWIFHKLLSK